MQLAFAAVVATVCLLAALPAPAAEHPPADLSIEYGFNRITYRDGLNMPVGAAASLGVNVTDRFALAVDVRWNRKSFGSESLNLMSFQAGPRLAFRTEVATPYVQVMAGVRRGSFESFSDTKFCTMPGAGVDIKISHRVGFRLGADLRFVFFDELDETRWDLLAHAGFVFRFGM